MKRLISALLVVSISASIAKPVKANPAVLAPVAFCAGTAGVGCILVGVATVGGIAYYFWRKQEGKKTYFIQSTGDGTAIAHWDTEKENRHWIFTGGEKQCRKMAKNQGRKYKIFIPSGADDGSGICVMHGEQTNYGNQN
jgi:hypothetical protein